MNVRQLLKNIASNYVRMALQIATTIILTPLIVYKLGSESLGLWALTNTVAGYFSLTDLGISAAAGKYISHYRAVQQWDDLNKTIKTSMTCFSLLAFASLAAGLVMSQYAATFFHLSGPLVYRAHTLMIIVGWLVALGFFTVIPMQCAIASQRQDVLNAWMMGVQVVTSIGSVIVVYLGGGVILLAWLQVFSTICNGIIAYVIGRKYLPEAKFGFGWSMGYGKLMASFAAFALLVTLAGRIIYFTDSIVIAHYLTMVAVAGYSIGLKIIEFMKSIVNCGGSVLGTFVNEQSAQGKTESLGLMWIEGTKWALVITLPLCLLCVLNGSDLITSWVKTEYPQAGLALGILSIGLTFDLAQTTGYQILINGGRHRITALALCIEAIANLCLSLLLVKPLGLVGVALGTLIPQTIRALVVFPMLMPKVTGIGLPEYLQKAVVPAFKAASLTLTIVALYKICGLHTGRISLMGLALVMSLSGIIGVCLFSLTDPQRERLKSKLMRLVSSNVTTRAILFKLFPRTLSERLEESKS